MKNQREPESATLTEAQIDRIRFICENSTRKELSTWCGMLAESNATIPTKEILKLLDEVLEYRRANSE